MHKPEHETNIGALIPILFWGLLVRIIEYYIPPHFLHRIPLLFQRVPLILLGCGGLLVVGLRV